MTTKGKGWGAHRKASKLVLARVYVNKFAPYLAPTLFGLIPTPVENLRAKVGGPLAVTKRLVMYYDPAWVEEVPTLVLATGLGHEIMHVQLNHVARGTHYPDKARFNRAGDLFINSAMRDAKRTRSVGGRGKEEVLLWQFPDWALMPEKYGFPVGLTADKYYRLLEEYEKNEPKKEGSADCGGSGSDASEGNSDGKPSGESHIMRGCCGGIAGNPLNREMENNYDTEKGRSEANINTIAKATANAIKTHMESLEGRGTLSGIWSELIHISEKKFDVPWNKKLANVMRHAVGRARTGGLDYSMKRLSKRSYLRGIRLPSLVSYDPIVWFIVDSSGSMGNEQLSDASKICRDVLTQAGITEAWWMEADVEHKREPLRIHTKDLGTMEIRGRGGTDFRPAIEFVTQQRPKPQIVIYITDGVGPAPELPPVGVHFIWVIIPSAWAKIPARWGDMVILTDHIPGFYQDVG